MKTAIILHGMPYKEEYFDPQNPSQSNMHWIPWLQQELILRGVLAQTPEFPEPYEPDYKAWKMVFDQFHVDENTILIGHSCGGGFLVRWLSENNINVGQVILAAPWLDPDISLKNDMLRFEIDRDLVQKTAGVSVIVSTDDFPDIIASVDTIVATLPEVEYTQLTGLGHFTAQSMGRTDFPELLSIISV